VTFIAHSAIRDPLLSSRILIKSLQSADLARSEGGGYFF
jgi:hypothetical protein